MLRVVLAGLAFDERCDDDRMCEVCVCGGTGKADADNVSILV